VSKDKRQIVIEIKDPDVEAKLARIEEILKALLAAIVLSQKDACAALGIDQDTMRRKAQKGEVEILSADGSTRNFVTLKMVAGLKPTLRKKRKANKG
jgi:hypothetical protein